MLHAHDLKAGYGRIPVLHGVSFQMAAGEFTGILGRNGMGKTTLLRALMGELPLTGGELTLGERKIGALAPHARARQGLGFVPQPLLEVIDPAVEPVVATVGVGDPPQRAPIDLAD